MHGPEPMQHCPESLVFPYFPWCVPAVSLVFPRGRLLLFLSLSARGHSLMHMLLIRVGRAPGTS